VVAQERDELAPPAHLDQEIEDAPAVRPPVDAVAQGDDGIVGAGPDGL
jgi:hypothetical protein